MGAPSDSRMDCLRWLRASKLITVPNGAKEYSLCPSRLMEAIAQETGPETTACSGYGTHSPATAAHVEARRQCGRFHRAAKLSATRPFPA